MNIVLAGGRSALFDALIRRLSRETHRLFHLTGTESIENNNPRIYEQFHFLYLSEMIPNILERCNPDVIIFMGDYDTNLSERIDKTQETVYISGLLNIIDAAERLKKPVRFIFLSSERGYELDYKQNISELTAMNPDSNRQRLIKQCEEILLGHIKVGKVDPVVLRLDHVYGTPVGSKDLPEDIDMMVYRAVSDGAIVTNPLHEISMLHVKDAAECISKVVNARTHNRPLYHVSSGTVMNETELAELVIRGIGANVTVRASNGVPIRRVLAGDYFASEFEPRFETEPRRVVPKIASDMNARSHALFGVSAPRDSFLSRISGKLVAFISRTRRSQPQSIERFSAVEDDRASFMALQDQMRPDANVLEKRELEEVIFDAVELIGKWMGTNDVSIYTVDSGTYASLFSASSERAECLGNLIKYPGMTKMYNVFKEGHVYMNHDGDESYPHMADVIKKGDKYRLIIMLWGLPDEYSEHEKVERLRALEDLICEKLLSANKYMVSIRRHYFKPNGEAKVLSYEVFTALTRAFLDAKQKNLVKVIMMEIVVRGTHASEKLNTVAGLVRCTDYIGMLHDGGYYVLLSNMDEENADYVKNRLEQNGIPTQIVEDDKLLPIL